MRHGTIGIMVSREEVVAWVAARHGPRHAEARTGDGGFAFWVSTQPDAYHDGDRNAMTYGNGPSVVLKATGAAWHLSSSPSDMPIFNATTEAEFRKAMKDAGNKLDSPHEWVGAPPPSATPDAVGQQTLTGWLAQRFGWHEDRHYTCTDLGFALVARPTPGTQNNGPILAVKRTGAVWYLGTDEHTILLALTSHTEETFHAALTMVGGDPARPHDRIG
jgi:hypothetical protein